MGRDLFQSAIRGNGDLAGVFEYDGDVGYFYLYDVSREDRHRVLDSIHVFSGATSLEESDVVVRWDDRGERVGLFLHGVQWAAFNTKSGRKFGGNFRAGAAPGIPDGETFGAC